MTFDPRSMERLRELGRQLPKLIEKPSNSVPKNNQDKKPLHAIETEENPQKLFQELIKASDDGTVPSHLIKRLKEVESKTRAQTKYNHVAIQESRQSLATINKGSEDCLYSDFEFLLLEEETN